MSKLELTIFDALSGTKKEIEEGKKTTDIKMVTGAVHSEGWPPQKGEGYFYWPSELCI